MPGRIEWTTTDRFAIQVSETDRHVSAILYRAAGARWMMDYTAGGAAHTVDLVHARTPWPSALRRALAECEQHMPRR
jgi:hypothetical protein